VSRTKVRMRNGANQYHGVKLGKCSTCGEAVRPHRVCMKCGTYGGRQVISVTAE
jgi:large subunit ribosomal protein L32